MPDRQSSDLQFESADPGEQKLWAALEDLPRGEPSSRLRRSFYENLESRSHGGFNLRIRAWLGLGNNRGWLTAAVCLVLGFGLSQVLLLETAPPSTPDPQSERLAVLERNVAQLNRELILGRLTADSAGTRLQGVLQASNEAARDGELARALLETATQDRSSSVRSAAIDALGPQLKNEEFGSELMNLLEEAESPIVQLALVDLVLRHGDWRQVEHLRGLAEQEKLHPDLIRHVQKALGGQSA